VLFVLPFWLPISIRWIIGIVDSSSKLVGVSQLEDEKYFNALDLSLPINLVSQIIFGIFTYFIWMLISFIWACFILGCSSIMRCSN